MRDFDALCLNWWDTGYCNLESNDKKKHVTYDRTTSIVSDYLFLQEMEAVKAFKSNPELSKWKRREGERVECREGETNGLLSNRNKSARGREAVRLRGRESLRLPKVLQRWWGRRAWRGATAESSRKLSCVSAISDRHCTGHDDEVS